MRYYDDLFRKHLIDMLNTYRRILSQMELSQDKNFNNIFISDSIKKIDEAFKIIKPSAFDFLTEKKIEKLQTSEYLNQEIAKIKKEFEAKEKQLKQETENQLREKLTKEIRAELETQIRKEIADKANEPSEQTDKESTTSENTEDIAFTDFDDEDNISPVE